jgi:hypothetical protein
MAHVYVRLPVGERVLQAFRAERGSARRPEWGARLRHSPWAGGAAPVGTQHIIAANQLAGTEGRRTPNLVNPEVSSQ